MTGLSLISNLSNYLWSSNISQIISGHQILFLSLQIISSHQISQQIISGHQISQQVISCHQILFLSLHIISGRQISHKKRVECACHKLSVVVSQISAGWKIYLSGSCQLNFNGFLLTEKNMGSGKIYFRSLWARYFRSLRYFVQWRSCKSSRSPPNPLCRPLWCSGGRPKLFLPMFS